MLDNPTGYPVICKNTRSGPTLIKNPYQIKLAKRLVSSKIKYFVEKVHLFPADLSSTKFGTNTACKFTSVSIFKHYTFTRDLILGRIPADNPAEQMPDQDNQ